MCVLSVNMAAMSHISPTGSQLTPSVRPAAAVTALLCYSDPRHRRRHQTSPSPTFSWPCPDAVTLVTVITMVTVIISHTVNSSLDASLVGLNWEIQGISTPPAPI